MAGQKPRQGWIYFINPYKVSLRCKLGHTHIYELNELGEVECKNTSCTLKINSSRVFRGEHPHVIWTSDKLQDESNYVQTFTVIPLTSKETYKGLSTVYPINATAKNGLSQNSYALVHQICTVDANSFKDALGSWHTRIGQLDTADKSAIEQRLKYFLDIQENPSEDWFAQNSSLDILKKVFYYLPENEKKLGVEQLMDDLYS